MIIEEVRYTKTGQIVAVIDGISCSFPDDVVEQKMRDPATDEFTGEVRLVSANPQRQIVLDWEAKGNTIEPYVDENLQPRIVLKRVIIDRLHALGKLEAAKAALDASSLYTRERWNARDGVYSNDPDTIALLSLIGVDVEAVLAE